MIAKAYLSAIQLLDAHLNMHQCITELQQIQKTFVEKLLKYSQMNESAQRNVSSI